jgi:hypothetical protein
MSEELANFDYNSFDYWTYNGISQMQDAWYMMTLPTVYPELMIWVSMYMEIMSCRWMMIGVLRNQKEPQEMLDCLNLAVIDKLGMQES